MAERINGLTRNDLWEILGTYANTHEPGALAALAQNDKRFWNPAFHAMLRQEHIGPNVRGIEDQRLKDVVLAKYYFFFRSLHFMAYEAQVKKLAQEISAEQVDSALLICYESLIEGARSGAELALAYAAALFQLGTLRLIAQSGTIEMPLAVDRDDPLATAALLEQAAEAVGRPVPEHIRRTLWQHAETIPGNRTSLANCLVFACLRCGQSFAGLHRYFVDASDRTEFAEPLTLEVCRHSCPQCASELCAPAGLLAYEGTVELDSLLGSCCLIIPNRHSCIFLPPQLTIRNQDEDRILEIRLSELEEQCKKIFPPDADRARLNSYNISYTLEEAEVMLARAERLESGESVEAARNRLMGEQLVDEVVRKVAEGTLPLDMAMEHVRKFAQAMPDLKPPIPLFSDLGSSPERYLTSIIVTKAFYEERQGSSAINALLCIFASQAYQRVGADGLAQAELANARAFRQSAPDDEKTGLVDRMLLESEAAQAERHQYFDEAAGKLELLAELWEAECTEHPQDAGELEAAYNALSIDNRLGCVYGSQGRILDSLARHHKVESLGAKYAANPLLRVQEGDPDADPEDSYLLQQSRGFRYLQGAALANQGWTYREIGKLIGPMSANPRVWNLPPAPVLEAFKDLEVSQGQDEGRRWTIEFLTAALGAFEETPETFAEMTTQLRSAAVAKYKQALKISEDVSGYYFAAIQANAIAELLTEIGDADPAEIEAHIRKTIQYSQESLFLGLLTHAMAALSVFQEQAERINEAAVLSEGELRLLMQWRVASGVDDQRESLGSSVLNAAGRIAMLRYQLQEHAKVIEAIESAKCSLLSLELERAPLRLSEFSADDSKVSEMQRLEQARAQSWANVLRTGNNTFRSMQAEPPPPDGVSAQDLAAVEARISELQRELRSSHPRFDAWCRWSTVEPFQVADIRQAFARWRGPVRIVGFFVRHDTLWWYQVNGDDVRSGEVPLGPDGAQRLSAQVVRLRRCLIRDEVTTAGYQGALTYLSDLLAPAFDCIPHVAGAATVICPHESLLWFPWSLLPVQGDLLVDSGPIFTIPGLSILPSLENRVHAAVPQSVLVVANPQEGGSGELPGTALEADALKSKFGDNCTVISGSAATVSAVVSESAGKTSSTLAVMASSADSKAMSAACYWHLNRKGIMGQVR
jgi:hypothetical protein